MEVTSNIGLPSSNQKLTNKEVFNKKMIKLEFVPIIIGINHKFTSLQINTIIKTNGII